MEQQQLADRFSNFNIKQLAAFNKHLEENLDLEKHSNEFMELMLSLNATQLEELKQQVFKTMNIDPDAKVQSTESNSGDSEAAASVKYEVRLIKSTNDQKKITVIKMIKDACGLGLGEAKAKYDDVLAGKFCVLKTGLSQPEAAAMAAEAQYADMGVKLSVEKAQ